MNVDNLVVKNASSYWTQKLMASSDFKVGEDALRDKADGQSRTIAQQTQTIATQQALINSQQKQLAVHESRIEMLEDMVEALLATVKEFDEKASSRLNALETARRLSTLDASSMPPALDTLRPSDLLSVSSPIEEPIKTPSPNKRREIVQSVDDCPIYGRCYGYVNKLSSGGALSSRQWKKRWAVLKDDCTLRYYKTMKASTEMDAELEVIDLTGARVERAHDVPKPFAFRVAGSSGTYYFSVDNEEERARWLAALAQCIESTPSTRKFSGMKNLSASSADDQPSPQDPRPLSPNHLRPHSPTPSPPIGFVLTRNTPSKIDLRVPCETNQQHSECEGYLYKQNSPNSWAHAFFVLCGQVLYIYSHPASKTASGALHLAMLTIVEDTATPRVFELVHGMNGVLLTLQAESDSDYEYWIHNLRTAMAQSSDL